MVKYGTNASGAILWANLQLMQLGPSGGQIWNQYVSGASGGKIGNQCKLRDLLKLWTERPGSIVPLAMFVCKSFD